MRGWRVRNGMGCGRLYVGGVGGLERKDFACVGGDEWGGFGASYG